MNYNVKTSIFYLDQVSFHPSHLSSRRLTVGGTQPSPAPPRTPQRPIPTIANRSEIVLLIYRLSYVPNSSRTPGASARPSAAASSTPRSNSTSSSQQAPTRAATLPATNIQPAGNQPIRVNRPSRSTATASTTPAPLNVATPGMKSLNQPDPRAVAELDGEDEKKVCLFTKQPNFDRCHSLRCPCAPSSVTSWLASMPSVGTQCQSAQSLTCIYLTSAPTREPRELHL